MTHGDPQEPERWVVSADAPPDLRALLEVARREGPSIVQRASLGSRLGLTMQQALIGVGTKGFAAVTIVLAGVAGAGLGLSAGRNAPVDVPAAVSQAEAPAPPAPAPITEATTAVLEPQQPAEPSSPPAVAPPAKPPSEAALIRSARDALVGRPNATSTRRARGYLERHRRHYPDGQLAQEREVLLIEVLRLEGHEAEANARAAEFRLKNPDSAHRPTAP